MSDWYQNLTSSDAGGTVAGWLNLPKPEILRRYQPDQPLVAGPAVVSEVGQGALRSRVEALLASAGADVRAEPAEGDRLGAVVVDATAVADLADLARVHALVAPAFRRLGASGRLLVLARPPEEAADPEAAAARRALEGYVRTAGKEARFGATANLVSVAEGAEPAADSTLRFLLSARSAYVDGQHVRVGPTSAPVAPPEDPERPLAGRTAVVTGAARGIGAAIVATLARDGARIVGVDVPGQGSALAQVVNTVGGSALQLDITSPDAPERLLAHVAERHGALDVVVHNAGITRDKLLVNTDTDRWDSVLAVNLGAQLTIDRALLASQALGAAPRIVAVSSTSGIAGNRGQANYAASKAGVIGRVQAMAPELVARGGTINAVAPGFIETEMTGRMPVGTREAGRRVNSLRQGGQPVDVAETIGWLAQAGSGGVNGQVVRVCGQSLVGA